MCVVVGNVKSPRRASPHECGYCHREKDTDGVHRGDERAGDESSHFPFPPACRLARSLAHVAFPRPVIGLTVPLCLFLLLRRDCEERRW